MKKLFKIFWLWLIGLFKSKPTIDSEVKRITELPEFKKLQRIVVRRAIQIRRKALRNSKKRWATIKSFSLKDNPFIRDIKKERNSDAILYLKLKNMNKLPFKKDGTCVLYKEWIEYKII